MLFGMQDILVSTKFHEKWWKNHSLSSDFAGIIWFNIECIFLIVDLKSPEFKCYI